MDYILDREHTQQEDTYILNTVTPTPFSLAKSMSQEHKNNLVKHAVIWLLFLCTYIFKIN